MVVPWFHFNILKRIFPKVFLWGRDYYYVYPPHYLGNPIILGPNPRGVKICDCVGRFQLNCGDCSNLMCKYSDRYLQGHHLVHCVIVCVVRLCGETRGTIMWAFVVLVDFVLSLLSNEDVLCSKERTMRIHLRLRKNKLQACSHIYLIHMMEAAD
jgi:hypothetical protein